MNIKANSFITKLHMPEIDQQHKYTCSQTWSCQGIVNGKHIYLHLRVLLSTKDHHKILLMNFLLCAKAVSTFFLVQIYNNEEPVGLSC